MPFAAALSQAPDTARALEEVCTQAAAQMSTPADLALVFFSPHHVPAAAAIAAELTRRLGPRCLLGCSGESIVGTAEEVENDPALSLWLGSWNGQAQIESFHLNLERTPDGPSLLGWPDGLLGADLKQSLLVVLGDPFTFPTDPFLSQVNEQQRGLRVLGGMASAGRQPGDNRLLLGERALDQGAVGVLLQGPMRIRSIVSQGCRPIGRHMVVTKAQDNIIAELGGKPPLVQLQQLWSELNENDQELFQQGLHIGRVINEYQGDFQRGEFLVRNVLGLDRQSGSLAITDRVRVGQTVQFHVRDADTADEDLHALLQLDMCAHEQRPQGALLFTCNGRGTRLFSKASHDIGVIRQEVGEVPMAGFFAMGELGPIGGQNFIHGFTASVVLFE